MLYGLAAVLLLIYVAEGATSLALLFAGMLVGLLGYHGRGRVIALGSLGTVALMVLAPAAFGQATGILAPLVVAASVLVGMSYVCGVAPRRGARV